MPEKGKEFRMYQDEGAIAKAKEKTWTISVRINAKEREIIDNLKKILNINMDGTAIKIAMVVGHNVLHRDFGADVLKYITSQERRRSIIE